MAKEKQEKMIPVPPPEDENFLQREIVFPSDLPLELAWLIGQLMGWEPKIIVGSRGEHGLVIGNPELIERLSPLTQETKEFEESVRSKPEKGFVQ